MTVMSSTDRFLTVQAAMEILPYKKTKMTRIFNSLPHLCDGKKLFVREEDFRTWIDRHMKPGNGQTSPAPIRKKPRAQKIPGLTEDGLIPYRHSRKGA